MSDYAREEARYRREDVEICRRRAFRAAKMCQIRARACEHASG